MCPGSQSGCADESDQRQSCVFHVCELTVQQARTKRHRSPSGITVRNFARRHTVTQAYLRATQPGNPEPESLGRKTLDGVHSH